MTTIQGDDSDEFILATGEADLIEAMGGNDTVIGNNSYSDRIYGGTGNDSLVGDQADSVYGGAGNDSLSATIGSPVLQGGAGNDTIMLNGSHFPGSGIAAAAHGGIGDDIVLVTAPVGGTAAGGSGNDLLGITTSSNFGDATGGSLDFSTGSGSFVGPGALQLTFSGFERLFFLGNQGADTVIGGASDDVAYLYDGANVAAMGTGNDVVVARYGAMQSLDGGDGHDVLALLDAVTPVYFIFDSYDGTVDDGQLSVITGFEEFIITGSLHADVISLGTGDDSARGGDGDDTLFGMGGADTLYGEVGNDSVVGGDGADFLSGGRGNDTIKGGQGTDVLNGNRGEDDLHGGDGDDRISGGRDNDTVTGGAGSDHFVFRLGDNGLDLITDFTSGVDQVEWLGAGLGALAPPAGVVGALALNDGAPVGTAAQFVTQYDALQDRTALLYFDQGTATTGSFLLVAFSGAVTLTEGDLVLI